MRILFLSRWFPYPTNNGSKLRVYNLLRGLAQRHEITLVSFADELNRSPDPSVVAHLSGEVHVVPWRDAPASRLADRRALFSPRPRSIVQTHSPDMAATVRRCLQTGGYDVVVASQLATAAYATGFGTTPALFEEVESGVYWAQYAHAVGPAARMRNGLTWHKHRRYLAHLLRRFSACTVASAQERALLAEVTATPPRVAVVPNGIDMAAYAGVRAAPRRNQLIFTGSFRYGANHAAMVWFLEQVYPRIQHAVPDVALTITGDHAGLPLPAATGVTLTGQVPNVRPLVATATCSIVPLQIGGGTRLKVLEAMALGTPVVSTAKGAEGLDVRHDEHLLLADTPDAFAAAVIRLLADPEQCRRLAGNARALVATRYDWSRVLPAFVTLVEQTAQNGARAQA